jgi:hypothetical protein
MFGRKDKSKEAQGKRIKFSDRIKYLGLVLIAINYLIKVVLLTNKRFNEKV